MTPPLIEAYRPEAEAAVLGSMILDPDCVSWVMDTLTTDDFYLNENRIIFEGFCDLYLKAKIDFVLLRDWLATRGKMDEVGGVNYLKTIANCTPSSANVQYYTGIVRNKSKERQILQQVQDLTAITYGSDDIDKKIEAVQNMALSISSLEVSNNIFHVSGLAAAAREELENPQAGLLTGFSGIDEKMGGCSQGDMIIVAARPSMGKTTLALNCALHQAESGANILFFSLEMTAKDLAKRMLQKLAKIDSVHINKKWLTEQDRQNLSAAEAYLKTLDLTIIEASGWTPERLQARVKTHTRKKQVNCVYVDYLGLMNASNCSAKATAYEKTTEISKQLKAIALSEKIPIVAVCQLNRMAESRKDHRPQLSDLRDSGGIEQDADVVMLIHWEDYYHRHEKDYTPTGDANCIIAKNRRGACGDIELGFLPEIYTFADKVRLNDCPI